MSELGFEIVGNYKDGTMSILDDNGNGPTITTETLTAFLLEISVVAANIFYENGDDNEDDTD